MHGTARRDSKLSSSGPFRSSDSLNSLDRAHRTRVGYGTPSPSPFEGDSLHGRSGVSGNSSNRRKRLWNPSKWGRIRAMVHPAWQPCSFLRGDLNFQPSPPGQPSASPPLGHRATS